MAAPKPLPGQVWKDDCYYFDPQTGECRRKYRLVLAVDPASGDCITLVFTSRPNGLTEDPPCSLGPPRAGFYLGPLGGPLQKPTWLDFSSVHTLDRFDLGNHVRTGRTTLTTLRIPQDLFCAALRCALRCEDISLRELRWVGDTAAELGCP